MLRILEVIFRKLLLFVALLLLLPLLGLVIGFLLPRSYQVTSNLWALRRYAVIGASGPEANLQATPADTQTTALTEFLHTRLFALTVAKSTNLASVMDLSSSVRNDPSQLDDALFTEVSTHVLVQSQGYNLFTVTYTNKNPQMAQKIVKAVIQGFDTQSQSFSTIEGQQLLQSYQTQLQQAQNDLDNAVQAETDYIRTHPGAVKSDLQADPQYAQLHAQTLQDQASVQNINTSITSLQQQIDLQGQDTNNFFKVIDDPQVPTQPVSRSKTVMTAAGVGLGIALVTILVYTIILVRRDRAVYSSRDLEALIPNQSVMELPRLTSTPTISSTHLAPNGTRLTNHGS